MVGVKVRDGRNGISYKVKKAPEQKSSVPGREIVSSRGTTRIEK